MSGIIPESDAHFETIGDAVFAAISSADIQGRHFIGKPLKGQSFHGNFVECRFEQVVLEDMDFSRCDWKDCSLEDTIFIRCKLDHSSLISNQYRSCKFIRCIFTDTSISECDLVDTFIDSCDLRHIIIKSAKVQDSHIIRCQTSNRIIESSILLNTKWIETDVEAALVLGNFGVENSDLEHCVLYVRAPNGTRERGSWDDLETRQPYAPLSPIERFRLAYFRTGTADGDADALQTAIELTNWKAETLVQASFGSLLSNFADFLLTLYAADKLPAYAILLFHSANYKLLDWLSSRARLAGGLHQVVGGVHWALSREVQDIAAVIHVLIDMIGASAVLRFAAEGPLDCGYYEELLNQIGMTGVSVVAVRPRNSPVDLALQFADRSWLMTMVALFVACHTKVGLLRLPAKVAQGRRGRSGLSADQEMFVHHQIISLESGFGLSRPDAYDIRMQTLLPSSLLLDLRLSLSVSSFKRATETLKEILGWDGDASKDGSL